jgi:hypothetical protein
MELLLSKRPIGQGRIPASSESVVKHTHTTVHVFTRAWGRISIVSSG